MARKMTNRTSLLTLAVCLLLLAGCAEEEKKVMLLPPAFNRGDVVTINATEASTEAIGIITRVEQLSDNTWQYVVMFKDEDIAYGQDLLKIVERFDWSRRANQPVVKAEIDH